MTKQFRDGPTTARRSNDPPRVIQRAANALIALLLLSAVASAQTGKSDFAGGLQLPASPALAGTPSDDSPVSIESATSRDALAPGDQLTLVLTMVFQDGWHSWPAADLDLLPDDMDWAIQTTVSFVDPPDWLRVGPTQWPTTKATPVAGIPDPLPTFGGRAPIFIPTVLASDAPAGEHQITVRLSWQACNDVVCDPPADEDVTFTINVAAIDEIAGATADPPAVFRDFDASTYATSTDWGGGDAALQTETDTSGQPGRKLFGIPVPSPTGVLGITLIALLSMLGGAILNLTPCVLPVIPLKVMAISAHAKTPGKTLTLGLAMAFGVVAFWGALGVLAATAAAFADPSRLFAVWWLTLAIGLIIGIMGVGIMGAFEIRLPKAVNAINPKADTVFGSVLFGIMTAVLGLPCFGFVAGALLAATAAIPNGETVNFIIFLSIGIGMAVPYLVLSIYPSLVNKIPRTGPASELVKHVMGLLLLAAAAYFIGSAAIAFVGGTAGLPWWAKSIHWWVVGLFATAAGVWLAWQAFVIWYEPVKRGAIALVGMLIVAVSVFFAIDRTTDAYNNIWIPFTPEALADAREDGNVVVIDFTAEWCINCKVLKATVLSKRPVKPLLTGGGVVTLVADLTALDAPGWVKLREMGYSGIPLLAIYPPDHGAEPWLANNYTPGQVVAALRAAGITAPVQTAAADPATDDTQEQPAPAG